MDLEWCLEAGITGPYKPHLLPQKRGIVAALQSGKDSQSAMVLHHSVLKDQNSALDKGKYHP